MSQVLKVKVKPGRTLQFPAVCVHCSQPASDRMQLRKRKGRLTRLIDVPICAACAAELKRQSGEEERLWRLGRFIAVAASLVILLLMLLVLPGSLPFWFRLLFGLVWAIALGVAITAVFWRKSRQAALPEKLAIIGSARLADFSWRAATFAFENEAFAERFAQINEPRIMEL